MKGSARTSLPSWLSSRAVVTVAVLLAVGVWLGAAWLISAQRAEWVDRALERATLHARVMEDQAVRSMSAVDLALDAAALRWTPATLPRQATEREPWATAAPLALPFVRSISWLDAQGHVLASSDEAQRGMSMASEAGAPVALRLQAGLQPQLFAGRGPADHRPLPGQSHLRVLRPWGQGWVLATLSPDYFATQHALILGMSERSGALLAWGGELLTATPALALAPGAALHQHALFQAWLPGRESGVWVGDGLDGRPSVQAFRAVRGLPLLVWAAEPVELAVAPLAAVKQQVLGGALALTVALVGMAMAAVRSLRGHAQVSRALADADARVASSERDLRTLVEGVHEWLFRTDSNGRLTYVNPRWRIISRWGDAHALGRLLEDLFAPDDRDRLRQALASVGRGQWDSDWHLQATSPDLNEHRPECQVQARLLRSQASPLNMEISLSPLRDAAGRRVGCAGFAVDVSEREAARQRLQGQLDFTAQLLAATPVPVFVTGLDGRVLKVNRAWDDLLAQGLPAQALLNPSAAPQAEWQLSTGAGVARDLLVSRVAFTDEAGQVAGTIGTVVDVTEFRAVARSARQAHEAAEALNQLKSEFISNISHELRTPLQSILGYAELGGSRAKTDARLADMFSRIHASGERMLALINDLLDASQIGLQAGTMTPMAEDLARCLDRTLRALMPQAQVRQILLESQCQPGLLTPVFADPARLQQAIRIVLLNALKFAPAGSVVSCHLAEEAGWLVLRVADRGPGIPDAELETIFQPFVQSSRTRDGAGGAGLGLGIARRILRAHGGDLRAAHREGGGAIFSFKLRRHSEFTAVAA